MKAFLFGIASLRSGFSLIWKPGIRPFVWIPLGINVVLLGSALFFAFHGFEALLTRMASHIPEWLQWLRFLLWPLFIFALAIAVFYGFSVIANLIASPFNGLLSEAVAATLDPNLTPPSSSWKTVAADILPSIWSEIRKLLYALRWLLPCLFLSIVPGINLLAPFAWTLFGAWMLAIEYGDYPMANAGLRFVDQRKRIRHHRLANLGFGGAVMLTTLVPVLNLVVMPAAVAGATALWYRLEPPEND